MAVLFVLLLALQSPPSCPDAASCRAEAEAAAARGEFEAFHDLAWRAVQKGRPNDPALMFLLARAQSVSGRPGDALVMLTRLADMHAPVDLTLPDFERVRQLPGWEALAARVGGPPASPDLSRAAAASPPSPAAAPVRATPDSLPFDVPDGFRAFAMAHDSVSRRFVIGDAPARRLLVVDEVSRHVVPYVSAGSAGFYDQLTALTVDARRGDLWVVSAKGAAPDSVSILHKLQLVSGRGLMDLRPAESLSPVRFVDVAVTPEGTVLALDAAGGRLFRLRAGSRSLEVAQRLDAGGLSALAAPDEHTAFVASDRGVLRVDLASHAVQAIRSVDDLSGFISLAWRNGALIGVQHAAGASLVVRVVLDAAGMRARPRAILAASPSPIVGTLAGGSFYYLVDGTIKRLPLR